MKRRHFLLSGMAAIGSVYCGKAFGALDAKNVPLLLTDLQVAPEGQLPMTPYRGIVYTADNIDEVRRLAHHPHNKNVTAQLLEQAEAWLQRSDEEIIRLIPTAKDVFAIGAAGDPKTGQSWPFYARSDNMASLDKPGQLRSPYTGDIYGIAKPGEKYFDDGSGWVRPSDGRTFYFRAIWNSFVVREMHRGIDYLALAYLLTGDPQVARKALFILDHLSAVLAQNPRANFIDWPGTPTNEGERRSFFCYNGNTANQRALTTALSLDLLGNAPYASEPSCYKSTFTVFENIQKHYFDLYERGFYLDQRGALTNHGTSLFTNVLAQGVLFGNAEYLRLGIDAMYAFLDSTINRDGDYLELSGSYGRLGRENGSQMVALLVHYQPQNYANSSALPRREDFPHALNVADEERWYQTVVKMLYRMTVAGRFPAYGDSSPDRAQLGAENNSYLEGQRASYLRMFYEQTSRADWKEEIADLYHAIPEASKIPDFDIPERTLSNYLLFGLSQWKEPVAVKNASAAKASLLTPELLGGKNIAILRSGKDAARRALFMRGGINGAHGHDDQMAIIPYANGFALAGIYGYRYARTPDHLGWGTRAVSHQTAVINEDLPAAMFFKGWQPKPVAPSASVSGFITEGAAQMVEMNNPALWQHSEGNVQDYRRAVWMIDVSDEQSYFVDIFQLVGGNSHDYFWNAPYPNQRTDITFRLANIRTSAVPNVWTLSALSGKNLSSPRNKPGQSWGERLDGMAGRIKPLPGQSEKDTPQRGKAVPPGNGYEFIWDVKTNETEKDWNAVWILQDQKTYLKARMINFDGMTAITAKSPSLYADHHFDVIVARRTRDKSTFIPLQSRFVNVLEAVENQHWAVKSTEKLAVETSAQASDCVALKLDLSNNHSDYLLANRRSQKVQSDEFSFEGRNAFVRVDAKQQLTNLTLQEGTSLDAFGWKIELAKPTIAAKILLVDTQDDKGQIVIDQQLPAGDVLSGALLQIKNSANDAVNYSFDEVLTIEKVLSSQPGQSILQFQKQSLVLTRLQIDSIDSQNKKIETRWPCELAGTASTQYLQGRALMKADASKASALVTSFARKNLEVTSTADFQNGDKLKVVIAKPGDVITIPVSVSVTRKAENQYQLHTNAPLKITLRAKAGQKLMASSEKQTAKVPFVADKNGIITAEISPADFKSARIQMEVV